MKQLVAMFIGQFCGYALAITYPVAALGRVVSWSWLTFALLLTLLGVAGTLGGYLVARRHGTPPERSAGSYVVRGLLGAIIGLIITGNTALFVAITIAVVAGTGADGFERLWEDGFVWLTLVGLPAGYVIGRR